MTEGSLEVKLRTIWTDGKSNISRGEEKRRKKIREEKGRRKKIQARQKVGKSRNSVFFQKFGAPEGRKVGSLKRRVRSHWGDEIWKIVRSCGTKHILKLKCPKHLMFGEVLEVEMWEKSARRCGAKHISKSKVLKLTGSEHFWKFRRRKSARGCGAKRVLKPK